MQVRSVDIQVMVHRAPEMNRATNNDGSRAATQQNQFAQEFQKLRERERAQVVHAQEADENQGVNPDGSAGKEKQQQNKKKRPGAGQSAEPEKPQNAPGRGMLDIRM